MDGGAGKCGQNAGDVMEREIFRSSRGRLTAREIFGALPFERDDRLDEGAHAGGMLPLKLELYETDKDWDSVRARRPSRLCL